MHYLLDTGILLRVIHREDSRHAVVRSAVRLLKSQGHSVVTTPQNLAEFWNVCTRPASARGGFGLTVEEALGRLRLVERLVSLLPDSPDAYAEWRDLIIAHRVLGVQVHDARLVAMMKCHGVAHMLTLNKADFARYPGMTAIDPADLLSATPPPP